MEKKELNPEYIAMRDMALEQLKSGKSLTGKGGVFAPIIKEFLESALEAEMDEHLTSERRSQGNKRNGKGMSLRDIGAYIRDMYDVEVSPAVLSNITDRVIPQVKEWQNRPLDDVYPIVWMDAMHYKVRDGGRVVSRAVYNILAINKSGRKELIGMYISESEGANFWLSVLTDDLKSRGVKDILIACTDNLTGFSQAILSIFPDTEIQKCVIHQIRNSLKYVVSKDQKEFMKDLKKVYQAPTKSQA